MAMSTEPAPRPRTSRSKQRRATRRRIIDAAAELFIEHGYATTTLEQVADRAGVAVQTVYFHYGNKRTLLKEAVDLAAAGDDEPVAVLDRPWNEAMHAADDVDEVLSIWARNGAAIFERIAPIMGVVRDAAVVDAEMAEQWTTNESQRLTAFRELATLLDDRGDLRADLDVEQATDLVFALNSVEVYLLLTRGRGWTTQRWERWLTRTLRASLVEPQ
jgi:AcrR family transcriptional regulator